MKEYDMHRWGPDDELGQRIAETPYPEPTPDIVHRIMAPLKPIKPNMTHRLLAWFKQPMTFKMSPAVASLIVVLFATPWVFFAIQLQKGPVIQRASNGQTVSVPVEFHYNDKAAQSVAIMGSFNHWDPKGYELVWQPELEQWTLQVQLAPGQHDYVFLVNGEKVAPDPEADLIQADDFGNRNSVIFVKGKNGIHY